MHAAKLAKNCSVSFCLSICPLAIRQYLLKLLLKLQRCDFYWIFCCSSVHVPVPIVRQMLKKSTQQIQDVWFVQ